VKEQKMLKVIFYDFGAKNWVIVSSQVNNFLLLRPILQNALGEKSKSVC
jgi:hypothetical protein